MRAYKILGLAAVLVLIGAGCDSPTQKSENSEDKPAMEQTMDDQANNEEITDDEAMISSEGESEAGEAMENAESGSTDESMKEEKEDSDSDKNDEEFSVDETWNTYTSRSEDWQFNWPTKGLYAPMWSVSFAGDDELSSGCYGDGDTEIVTLSGVEFCHSHKLVGTEVTDHFVTQHGNTNIVLTFTKDTEKYAGFNMNDYQKHIKNVASTFKYLK